MYFVALLRISCNYKYLLIQRNIYEARLWFVNIKCGFQEMKMIKLLLKGSVIQIIMY